MNEKDEMQKMDAESAVPEESAELSAGSGEDLTVPEEPAMTETDVS